MAAPPPVTATERYLASHRWALNLALVLVALLIGLGVAAVGIGAWAALRFSDSRTPRYADVSEHFKYGSIGAEPESGVPYGVWKALPLLYPVLFEGRRDYAAFGFVYETPTSDLPIGVSRRKVSGVDVVWLNCATCHTGTWRASEGGERHIVPGMPSNNLDFHRFVGAVLTAAHDEMLAPDNLFPVMEKAGVKLGFVDRQIWRVAVLPRFREGLIRTAARLGPLSELQPAWGPGRVDTFNPYKLIQFNSRAVLLTAEERVGAADFPAIFNQGPRAGMDLHWDGNNASLAERNLSAAIGAGVTPKTVDHPAIERVAAWLKDLPAPPSPHHPDAAAVARGEAVYARDCAACHGRKTAAGYEFKGERLGKVEPYEHLGVDRARLDSYTEGFRDQQLKHLFAGTPYRFTHFKKTDGYANLPLDGLWLRGPYLHNGSVPTLKALLDPPAARPKAFVRGIDVVDGANGGFMSPACDPAHPPAKGFCFDTSLAGNGAGGHTYGTALATAEKSDLLAYLKTF